MAWKKYSSLKTVIMLARMEIIILLFCFIHIEVRSQTFYNVAPAQNIYHSDIGIDSYGSSVSFFDFDNDKWDDLTLIKENDSIYFYKNNGGIFEVFPLGLNISGETKHAIWVDYDNDGDNDLFLSIKNAPCKLYNNDGNFNLQDVSVQAGFQNSSATNYGVSFGDFNKDGFLDLYICRCPDSPGGANPSEYNALYKNNGNGTFTDIALQAGVADGIKNSFQAVWLDYNHDSWPDLYIINDRTMYDNSLYKNNGDETFTDVTIQCGAQDTTASPMTNTVADFDEDGDLDIFMTNTGYADLARLLVNDNGTVFNNQASTYGLADDDYTWGASWLDADNDTDLDLIICSDGSGPNSRTHLYMNTGNQLYIESPQNFQSSTLAASRTLAIGDISNDGKTDVIISNTNGFYSYLFENTGNNTNNFVKIILTGTVSNTMAIGSWINVYAGNKKFVHYTFCGENYLGQNSQNHIFGLGQITQIDSVIVNYPSGIIDKYYNLGVNERHNLVEGETLLNQIMWTGNLNLCEGDSVILDAGNFSSYLWSNGSQQQYISVTQGGSYFVTVTNALGNNIASDTVVVNASINPQISINPNHITCYNSNNGSIFLDIVNFTSGSSILWNNGALGDSIFNLTPNTYVYNYTDNLGCIYSDSATIMEPSEFNVQLQITDYSVSNNGMVQIMINGGTPPYSIYFNGAIAGNTIDSLLPGNYFFEIIDAQLCTDSVPFEIDFITNSFSHKNITDFIVYPNPIKDELLFINENIKVNNIRIYNSLGQSIKYQKSKNYIEFLEKVTGILFIEMEINNEVYISKLVKF